MKIILFNTFHNGDIFFTKEFIRAIVNNNPEHNFSIACRQFYSLFSDIKDLEISERPTDFDANIKSEDIDLTKEYYIKDNILYIFSVPVINVGTREQPSMRWECNVTLECFNKYFTNVITNINSNLEEVKPKLIFNSLNKTDFLPSIFNNIKFGDLPIIVQSSLKNQCIFYYNLKPLSTSTHIDDDKLIEALAIKYSEYTIIVTKNTTIKLKNIICLYDLDIEITKETIDGKNLLFYAYIASFCPIIILKDTGGALCVFNKYTMTSSINQYIILVYCDNINKIQEKSFNISFITSMQNLIIKDNKHLIPLNKYTPADIIGEIDKIGPISPANFTSTGGRLKFTRNRKSKGKMRKNKNMRLRSRNLRCKEKNK